MSGPSRFLFVVCQLGAEPVLKHEIAAEWPDFRLAFSRPGFITFKLPAECELPDDFDLRSVFARTYGFSLSRVSGSNTATMSDRVWELAGRRQFQHLHVWQRDADLPGENGFEPGVTPLAQEIAKQIAGQRPRLDDGQPSDDRVGLRPVMELQVNRRARPGEMVLDCVLVEPNEWHVGEHRAASIPSCWPGGVVALRVPPDMLSRAYLKMCEALLWSRFPIQSGDVCMEIGSSPGGAAQALLSKGLHVIGVDPAEMHPSLLAHPRFRHLRRRGTDVKHRDFQSLNWLVVDANIASEKTLNMVESIVSFPHVDLRGMLLTVKLRDWQLARQIPEYVQRVRSWGFESVRARQLAFNKQEICIAAMRKRSMRRGPRK